MSLRASADGFCLEKGVVPEQRDWCRAPCLATRAPREQPCTCPIVFVLCLFILLFFLPHGAASPPSDPADPLRTGVSCLLRSHASAVGLGEDKESAEHLPCPPLPPGHPSTPRCLEQPLSRWPR